MTSDRPAIASASVCSAARSENAPGTTSGVMRSAVMPVKCNVRMASESVTAMRLTACGPARMAQTSAAAANTTEHATDATRYGTSHEMMPSIRQAIMPV